jgi:hypothetical protein
VKFAPQIIGGGARIRDDTREYATKRGDPAPEIQTRRRQNSQRAENRYPYCCVSEAEADMSDQSPTADRLHRDVGEQSVPDEDKDKESRTEERNADDEQNQNKGHGPLKGTDTAATTYAEDLDKAKRTTM